jgi:hypothetical protein
LPKHNLMLRKTTLLAAIFLSLSTGCATILRGTRANVAFKTDPPGATVTVDGADFKTPFSLDLKRKVKHGVIVKADGYRTLQFNVEPQWDGVSLVGNIILPGGSIGLVIDHVDGSDYTFYKLATIKMVPTTQPEPALVYNCFQGRLMTDSQVNEAMKDERRDRSQFLRGEP